MLLRSSDRLVRGATRCLGRRQRRPLWQPPTPFGVNLAHGNFWTGTISPVGPQPGQWAAWRVPRVSWVRGTVNFYTAGGQLSQIPTPGCHWATRMAQSVRPLAADPTLLELTCTGSTYAIADGEQIVLSAPITYTDANGVAVTLPARTAITARGGTPGSVDGAYNSVTSSTIWVEVGQALADNGPVSASGIGVLHRNFYRQGTTLLRGQVAGSIASINAWLDSGYWVDWGGPHDQMFTLISLYGQEHHDAMRAQEWAHLAAQGWPADRLLMSAANEITWPSVSADRAWDSGWGTYFQGSLYPQLRAAFPDHTLVFGSGWFDGATAMPGMRWWPDDPNTMLAIHYYLDGVSLPVFADGTSVEALQAGTAWMEAAAARLGIPAIYFQEWGIQNWRPGAANRLNNARQELLRKGWLSAPWCATGLASDSFTLMNAATGVWRPVGVGVNAFGAP